MTFSIRPLVPALGAGLAVALLASSSLSAAPAGSLEGRWSGSGTVVFPSGESERARCRVSFKRHGGDSYGMHAVCATASARVEQTASLERVSGNRFSGQFHNAEYGISGSIRITVSGNSLSASLAGGGGTAHFNLGR